MKREFGFLIAVLATALAFSNPAFAHHPMGGMTPQTFAQGFLSGVGHPIIGVDHFAFLLVIALLSVSLGGFLRLAVPLAFVAATVAGTFAHIAAADFPLSEAIVASSALIGGLLVLSKRDVPGLLLTVGVTAFGLFHGYALGESIIGAEQTPLVAYLIGFAAIQLAVIVGAAWAFKALGSRSTVLGSRTRLATGVLATVTGAAFLISNLT
ncbi:MAG: hypothetical protein AMJ69_02805 [Gammaproteobacteria bacterium SG8_47]|nr:MAG: hypothetical protein AMJ69_02805 [Gammaproteobacteria bacterium SG8_47]